MGERLGSKFGPRASLFLRKLEGKNGRPNHRNSAPQTSSGQLEDSASTNLQRATEARDSTSTSNKVAIQTANSGMISPGITQVTPGGLPKILPHVRRK